MSLSSVLFQTQLRFIPTMPVQKPNSVDPSG